MCLLDCLFLHVISLFYVFHHQKFDLKLSITFRINTDPSTNNEPEGNSEEIAEDSQIQHVVETHVTSSKKRGRPVKRGDKEWQDEEVYDLIDLWSKHECLYNSKHPLYLNKTFRCKALDRIVETLKEDGIETNTKQVQEKLTKLRNYYGAEKRKEENSKVTGSGTDSLYISSWKFYSSLHFLRDSLTPRATVSNLDEESEPDTDTSIYLVSNPPSAKAARKIREKSRENAECVMAKASKALESITARYQQNAPEKKKNHEEDRLFSEMVYEMLSVIPDSQEKALAKVDFQQKLIRLKYGGQRQQTPAVIRSTSTFHPFNLPPYQAFPNTFMQTPNMMTDYPSHPSSAAESSTPSPSSVYQPFSPLLILLDLGFFLSQMALGVQSTSP